MTMGEDQPLWGVKDQNSRLAELTARTSDSAKEQPLRRDVRSLGILLGRILTEQSGEVLSLKWSSACGACSFSTANNQRSPATAETRTPIYGKRPLHRLEDGTPIEDAYNVTKAFAIYFELTNLAETNHRKRRRRAGNCSVENRLSPVPSAARSSA